jgi:hypothetical protein
MYHMLLQSAVLMVVFNAIVTVHTATQSLTSCCKTSACIAYILRHYRVQHTALAQYLCTAVHDHATTPYITLHKTAGA